MSWRYYQHPEDLPLAVTLAFFVVAAAWTAVYLWPQRKWILGG